MPIASPENLVLPRAESPERPPQGTDLFAKHDQLFRRLADEKKALTPEGRKQLVYRVLEHSVEDGLKLADLYRMGGDELLAGFQRASFGLKHKELAKRILAYFNSNNAGFMSEDARQIEAIYDAANLANKETERDLQREGGELSRVLSAASQEELALFGEADQYYTSALSGRTLAPTGEKARREEEKKEKREAAEQVTSGLPPKEKEPIKRRTGNDLGQHLLLNLRDAYDGMYSGGDIRRILLEAGAGSGLYYDKYQKEYPQYKSKDRFWRAVVRGDIPYQALTSPQGKKGMNPLETVSEEIKKLLAKKNMKLSAEERDILLHEPMLPKALVEKITGAVAQTPALRSKVERAQYKMEPITANVLRGSARRVLTAELTDSLAKRGYDKDKIAFTPNPDTGDYEAHYEGEKQIGGLDLENFEKTSEELVDDFDMKMVKNFQILEGGHTVFLCEKSGAYFLIVDEKNVDSAFGYDYIDSGSCQSVTINGKQEIAFLGGVDINGGDQKPGGRRDYFIQIGKRKIPSPPGTKGMTHFAVTDDQYLYVAAELDSPDESRMYMDATDLKTPQAAWYGVGALAGPLKGIGDIVAHGGGIFHVEEDVKTKEVSVNDGANQSLKTFSNGEIVRLKESNGALITFVAEKNNGKQYLLNETGEAFALCPRIVEESIKQSPVSGEIVCIGQSPDTKMPDGQRSYFYTYNNSRGQLTILDLGGRNVVSAEELDDAHWLLVEQKKDGKKYLTAKDRRVLSPAFDELKVSIENGQVVIAGIRDKHIVTYRKDYKEAAKEMDAISLAPAAAEIASGPITPTAEEKKKLALLTAIDHPSAERVWGYFKAYPKSLDIMSYADAFRESMKAGGRFARNVAETMTAMIQREPALGLHTMAAAGDRLDPTSVERLVLRLFPQVKERREREAAKQLRFWERAMGRLGRGKESGRGEDAPSAETYLRPQSSYEGIDGDPREAYVETIMEFREPPPRFVLRGVYNRYEGGAWTSAPVSIAPDVQEPVRSYTATIPTRGLREVRLPIMVGAQLLPERIRGVVSQQEDSTGMAICAVEKKTDAITYTQRVSELPPTLPDVSRAAYDKWRRAFERGEGVAAGEDIAVLPDEWTMFLRSIEGESPKRKVERIQTFLANLFHYDMDNREVQGMKGGKTIEERLSIMRARMEDLQKRHAGAVGAKQYAGVCVDFNLALVAMFRKAGIPSAILAGFRPKGKTITTVDAHAVAGVYWPSAGGETMLVPVDATPKSGVPDALREQLILPTVAETDKAAEEKIALAVEDAERVMAVLRGKNPEDIRALRNGELEQATNVLLQYEVKEPHVQMIRHILGALRFGYINIGTIDLKKVDDMVRLLTLVKQEARAFREGRRSPSPIKEGAGTVLFNLVRETRDRIRKQTGQSEAFADAILETVLDACKEYLDKSGVEQRVMAAILTFIQGKGMVK